MHGANVVCGTSATDIAVASTFQWDHVVKSENLQRLSFSQLDKDGDGYLSADDLKKHFGPAANVSQLIDAADKCAL
jgi:Ca2+-binding EF-hand superfamily protein